MRVCVLGTGYVGLVAGACFSDSGNHVVCVDINAEKVRKLSDGVVPIYEPGLEEIVLRNVKARRLSFTTNAKEAIGNSKVIFVAVGTPSGADGSLDLRYVKEALQTIRDCVNDEAFVVMKSTVPVGTADMAREILKGSKFSCEVISNPEFLKEGTAIVDFLKPERVVIGCQTEKAQWVMSELYSPYVRSGNPILFMSNRSAELAKYAANSFLAMKISYINDLAMLSENIGADIHDVRKVLVTDSRIGNKFLYPGCGYGGSCFPKDVLAMIQLGEVNEYPLEIFKAVDRINDKQKKVMFSKIEKHFGSDLKNKTITLWGLSFKPETDDMREAPSVTLIEELLEKGARVKAYDPVAMHEAKKIFSSKVEFYDNAYDALTSSDALAILTEWNEFRVPDFSLIKKKLKSALIFDGRNVYDPEIVERHGFTYYCIGRSNPRVPLRMVSST